MTTISPSERKIRKSLPLIRFFQNFIPLSLSQRLLKRGRARVQLDEDVSRQSVNADGVPCDWIIPKNSTADQVLLYLHGGGFVYGLTPQHLQMGAYLGKKMGVRVLMVDYRTAPEFPFPAALEDCTVVNHWLLGQGVLPKNIVVAGDSAGGNLTITMLMKLRDSGSPLPAAAACLSPVTDFSPKDNPAGFKDPLLPAKAIKFYTQAYLGNNDVRNPLISPVFGSLEGLPPLLVHAGEEEILREDAVRIVELAKSAGVDARLEIYPRMWHVWQINLALPQAIESLNAIAGFLKSHLA